MTSMLTHLHSKHADYCEPVLIHMRSQYTLSTITDVVNGIAATVDNALREHRLIYKQWHVFIG
jgi:hypothetical protein